MEKTIIEKIKQGDIGVIPTDTIYGLVGTALSQKVVKRIYKVRKRNPLKPLLILISSINDLKQFDIVLSSKDRSIIKSLWPGKVTVILQLSKEGIKKYRYLHRGTKTLAFRLPKDKELVLNLRKTGPLVAPSANPEGLTPAHTIEQAEGYFGGEVDFYVKGKTSKKPSRIVSLKNSIVEIIRK